MTILWVLLATLVGGFGVVLLFGAPYLPTRRPHAEQALELLNLQPGQVFYDLGCGDGRLVRLAARRGLKAIGYELNPVLFIFSWLVCLPVDGASVKYSNFWRANISNADGVFVFLIGKFMPRLDAFMCSQKFDKSVKLTSYAFKIPGKEITKRNGPILLYEY